MLRDMLRPPWRALRRMARAVTVDLPAALSVLPSLRRDPGQVTLAWPQALPMLGRDVALFAHFDAKGEVSEAVLNYLAALRVAGRSVLLVSNSDTLRPAALEALRDLCDGVVVRRNFGLDFAAWRAGLEHWGLPRADTRSLLLLNDSLAGPFAPLALLLRLGFPFVKRELLGRNPARVADVADWVDEVAKLTPTDRTPSGAYPGS